MIRLLSVTVLALAAGSPALMAQEFEFIREVAPGSRFVLRNIIGDVRIEAGPGRTLSVSGRKKPGRHGDPVPVRRLAGIG